MLCFDAMVHGNCRFIFCWFVALIEMSLILYSDLGSSTLDKLFFINTLFVGLFEFWCCQSIFLINFVDVHYIGFTFISEMTPIWSKLYDFYTNMHLSCWSFVVRSRNVLAYGFPFSRCTYRFRKQHSDGFIKWGGMGSLFWFSLSFKGLVMIDLIFFFNVWANSPGRPLLSERVLLMNVFIITDSVLFTFSILSCASYGKLGFQLLLTSSNLLT